MKPEVAKETKTEIIKRSGEIIHDLELPGITQEVDIGQRNTTQLPGQRDIWIQNPQCAC